MGGVRALLGHGCAGTTGGLPVRAPGLARSSGISRRSVIHFRCVPYCGLERRLVSYPTPAQQRWDNQSSFWQPDVGAKR